MSILSRILGAAPRAETYGPEHNFWYNPVGYTMGGRVDQATAQKLSAVWRCRAILCGTVASLPLIVYKRDGDDGKTRAPNHPLYQLLHDQPNRFQTSMEWRELMTSCAVMRGNGYSQILPGRRGAVDQLIPLHPDRVTPELQRDYSMKYRVLQQDGPAQTLFDDEVFHLRGPSDDGVVGIDLISFMSGSVGLGLKQERFAERFFDQSPQPSGVLESPKGLSDKAFQHLKESWTEAMSAANAHKPALLEEGTSWKPFSIGLTAEQAQIIASREHTTQDIARWFGIPNHLVGETTKETSWGSGIEEMARGFLTFNLRQWLTRWEQAISRDLIIATSVYFVEHLSEDLLRADTLTRYQAYAIATGNRPWMSPNEVRVRETMNPEPGLDAVATVAPGAGSEPGSPAAPPDTAGALVVGAGDFSAQRNGHGH